MAERRLDALTSLRFFACVLVVLFHYGFRATAKIPGLRDLVHVGYIAVSFFFVLSGFVLTAVYASKVTSLRTNVFYVARVARIVPVYALAILASLGLYVAHLKQIGKGDWIRLASVPFLLRSTFLSAWVPGYALELNGPAWTLSAEAFFYALFPFILLWAFRVSKGVRQGVVLTALLIGLIVPFVVHRTSPSMDPGSFDRTANYLPLFHLGSFLVGVEAGLFYIARSLSNRQTTLGLFIAFLAISLAVGFAHAIPAELLQCGLLAVPFATIVLFVAQNDTRLTVLRWAPLVLLGEASFAAYILQEPVGFFVNWFFGHNGRPGLVGSPVGMVTHLGLLGIVAVVVHGLLEVPARAWLRSRLEPKGSRESQSVASGIEA